MTIKENILLDDEFTEEEFFDAVRKSKVDKFVYLLENGYDTVVGGRGGKLSDGRHSESRNKEAKDFGA